VGLPFDFRELYKNLITSLVITSCGPIVELFDNPIIQEYRSELDWRGLTTGILLDLFVKRKELCFEVSAWPLKIRGGIKPDCKLDYKEENSHSRRQ
jgi:hypothetical protein